MARGHPCIPAGLCVGVGHHECDGMTENNESASGAVAGPVPEEERPAEALTAAPAAPSVPSGQMSPKQAVEALSQALLGVVNTQLAGIVATTSQGGAPPQIIVEAYCRAVGKIVGSAISVGDLITIMRVRENCREAFNDGIKGVQIKPPPALTPEQMAAMGTVAGIPGRPNGKMPS